MLGINFFLGFFWPIERFNWNYLIDRFAINCVLVHCSSVIFLCCSSTNGHLKKFTTLPYCQSGIQNNSSMVETADRPKTTHINHWLSVVASPSHSFSESQSCFTWEHFQLLSVYISTQSLGQFITAPHLAAARLSTCQGALLSSPLPPPQRNAALLYTSAHGRTHTRTLNHQPRMSDNRSGLAGTLQLFVSTCKSSLPLHR